MEKKFLIEDMSCAHCLAKIEKSLRNLKGIKTDIDLATKTLVATSKKEFEASSIINAVKSAGYLAKEV